MSTCWRRNAERNDAIHRRRAKLRALLGRKYAAAVDQGAKPAAESPGARQRRKLTQPTRVDSNHTEYEPHVAGAGSAQYTLWPAFARCQTPAGLLVDCLQC